MADFTKKVNKEGREIILNSIQEAQALNRKVAGTEHLLLSLLKIDTPTKLLLNDNDIYYQDVKNLILQCMADDKSIYVLKYKDIYTISFINTIESAYKLARTHNRKLANPDDILEAIIKSEDGLALRILNTMTKGKSIDIFSMLASDQDDFDDFFEGYEENNSNTPTLNMYSIDLTQMAKNKKITPVIGREMEIERVIEILARKTKNNPCLLGEPGVGKTAIVEGLAQAIVQKKVPKQIQGHRVVSLDLTALIAGTTLRGEFEDRVKKVIDELKADKKTILFIDEIHTIMNTGGGGGALDMSNILKPALSRGEIQIIGATTLNEYREKIEKDTAMERRFQSILVEEPSIDDTIKILKGLKESFEKYHEIKITNDAIESAVKLSVRYIPERKLPDKAIDVIDEACSRTKLKTTKKQIGKEEVQNIISIWTKIPLNTLTEDENKKLLSLEATLHKRVIGQDEAINAIAKTIRRNRVGINNPNRPIGSFLFLGPTGVGKTELCKAIAETVFNDKNAFIRIDMSEYMEKYSSSKLIGSAPGYIGYEKGGVLTEQVRRYPYSVVLFDEIEKADTEIFNLFLQILDEGQITDSLGKKVSFKNCIIIMTSNVGATNIVEHTNKLGFNTQEKQDEQKEQYEIMKEKIMEDLKVTFKPEFINRIDDIVVFSKLTKENIADILKLNIKDLQNRVKDALNVSINIDEKAQDLILEKGYKEEFGARELKRVMQSMIEDLIAESQLKGMFKQGDTINISEKDKKLTISVENKQKVGAKC